LKKRNRTDSKTVIAPSHVWQAMNKLPMGIRRDVATLKKVWNIVCAIQRTESARLLTNPQSVEYRNAANMEHGVFSLGRGPDIMRIKA
jgi:hypothetical protein